VTPEPEALDIRAPDGTRLSALLRPAPAGAPGVVVVHGLGSRKENNADVSDLLAAAGMATVSLDLRGHGASDGELGPGMLDDVLAALDHLREAGHGPLGLRGSSLGGFLVLHAAVRHDAVRAVAAVCPAMPSGLAARVAAEWPLEMPLEPTIPPGDGVARAIWHATGDEIVPWSASQALADLAPDEIDLRLVPGGGHRTLQHDPDVMAEIVAMLAGALGAGR
jgi:pimeloyl-ACP methyl ester carboxylesterase